MPAGSAPTEVGNPEIKPMENKSQANKKLAKIPAKSTMACCHLGLLTRLRDKSFESLSRNPTSTISASSKLSPKIFTNPPKGRALMEYSVSPIFLLNNLGGKPKPNSSTRMPNLFAVKKCPNSWTRTSTKSMMIKIIIDICILSHYLFFFFLKNCFQFAISFSGDFLQFFFSDEHFVLGNFCFFLFYFNVF